MPVPHPHHASPPSEYPSPGLNDCSGDLLSCIYSGPERIALRQRGLDAAIESVAGSDGDVGRPGFVRRLMPERLVESLPGSAFCAELHNNVSRPVVQHASGDCLGIGAIGPGAQLVAGANDQIALSP